MRGFRINSIYLIAVVVWLGLSACDVEPMGPSKQIYPDTSTKYIDQALKFACGNVSSRPEHIPEDVYDWGKYAWSGDNRTEDYQAIQGWFQAVSLNPESYPDPKAMVEVDFVMLIEVDRNSRREAIVAFLSYETLQPIYPDKNMGGLFSRWYQDNSSYDMVNAEIKNGYFRVKPAEYPNLVSHWWMNNDGKYLRRRGYDYYMKCRFRVTGNITFQFAADYYKTMHSSYPDNTEAFHSPWYGNTWDFPENEDGFITICFPRR